jgi:hypothetical protein
MIIAIGGTIALGVKPASVPGSHNQAGQENRTLERLPELIQLPPHLGSKVEPG